MKKILSLSLSALSVVALVGSMLGGLTADALGQGVATSVNANVRDVNCNKINTIQANLAGLFNNDKPMINCTVNGVKYTYSFIEFQNGVKGYVATNFLVGPQTNNPDYGGSTSTKLIVNSVGGINLRDGSCNKFGTMPNGLMAVLKQKVGYCVVNGVRYNMIYVQFDNGTKANVAESLVKYM